MKQSTLHLALIPLCAVAALVATLLTPHDTTAEIATEHTDAQNVQYEGQMLDGRYHGYGLYRHGDTTYQGFFHHGLRHGQGRLTITDRCGRRVFSGNWRSGQLQGHGRYDAAVDSTYEGQFDADTIVSGTLSTARGARYEGTFDRYFRPSGYGRSYQGDRPVYEGDWADSLADGFGWSLTREEGVRCGWWKAGRFNGERMRYTPDRVYGIDISHYQHGGHPRRGVRTRAINWKKMRITSLGKNTKNTVGVTDFPISFCYIKSTQGVKIRNSFYPSDARAARAQDIKVGAYHFFDLKAPEAQAKWFLRNTQIQPSDLPPMLDMELSNKQIAQLGGDSILFERMLVWLDVVEKATGKRPLLYLSQTFVSTRMSGAPERLKSYDVWIARYSEFKPYVRLKYWQLTPQGRVSGIQGDVDINIFNGSKEQFEAYCHSNDDSNI